MASKNVETQPFQTPLIKDDGNGTPGNETQVSIAPQRPGLSTSPTQENFADYVAELQLHMALQAKNLVPSMGNGQTSESRASLLHETQALVEKQISRQI